MKLLLIEPYAPETYPFISGLHEATYCDVLHAQSLDEGLSTMKEKRVSVMIVNLDKQEGKAWQVAERIRSEARDAFIRCPYLIFLSARKLPIEDIRKCCKLDVAWMLREWWPAIFQEVRRALWIREPQKMNSTLRFECHQGHHVLYQCVDAASEQIGVAFQVAKLAFILTGGLNSYTLQSIADELGVCCQSVKKYMWELRERSVLAQQKLHVFEPDRGIFWMERRAGGTVCGIKANIIWN